MNQNYNQEYFEKRDLLLPHLADLIKNIMSENHLKKALDVGCGTGRLVQFLNKSGFETFGCDISQKALKVACKINKKGTIVRSQADKLPYADNSYDLVTAISVIEHLKPNQVVQFFKEAKRVLKPGGFIFLVTPNFAAPLRFVQGKNWFGYHDPTHINFYTPMQLAKLTKKHGFGNVRFHFKIKYRSSFDWEFPAPFPKLPKVFKVFLIHLLFTTPLFIVRNSFWLSAQKETR